MPRSRIATVAAIGIALLTAAALARPLVTHSTRVHSNQMAPPVGDTTIVFGPMTFATPTGSAANHVETFTAADPTNSHALLIEFGDPSGSGRPTGATIVLNGATIATQTDFASGIAAISPPVNVLTTNTLQITVSGTAGAFVRTTLLAYTDGSTTLFGPKTYQRSGAPKDVVDTFALPSGTKAPYRIHLRSGDLDGANRPSSAYVIVNGVTIFGTSDFQQSFGGAVREFSPNAQNTITVGGLAPSGSRVTVRITGTEAVPPTLSITSPSSGTVTSDATILASGTIEDASPVSLTINGQSVALGTGGSFATAVALQEGQNQLLFVATDVAGNTTQGEREVIRDCTPPALSITSPLDNFVTRDDSVLVSGTTTDAGSVDVLANGYPLSVAPDGSFAGRLALSVGVNAIVVTATDNAGNQTAVPLTVLRDTVAPQLAVSSPVDSATIDSDSVTVGGTVTDGTAVTLKVNEATIPVSDGSAFSSVVSLVEGSNTIRVEAVDAAGNTVVVERYVTRPGPLSNLPPDPATVAPPLNGTISTSMAAATAFLYTGTDPIQRDVTPGAIKPMTVAVIRGRVLDRNGDPLPGVTVTVVDRPELGNTRSRLDGAYDLAVNGGGIVVVNYARTGYLPAQRHISAPWRDYRLANDVRLVKLDTTATVIDFSAPIQTARGSAVTDQDGTRRATMLFPQGTVATMTLPNGTSQPLSSLTVRATEYTVGSAGTEAMPADLPQNTSYTYAAELSADEALAAGATTIQFSQPVKFYLENFVGFPVGSIVPVGTYDREKAVWIPEDNGRVIKVLSTTGGVASVDVTGSGQPADAATLQQYGFTTAELEELATLYSPGQTLWRTLHTHFSTIDWNWRLVLPDGAGKPDQSSVGEILAPACKSSGSVIGCESQTLGEVLPVIGTGFSLVYSSDRVPGRTEDYTLDISLSGTSVPAPLKRIELAVTVAGRVFKQSFPATPNQVTAFTWDGVDAYGRRPRGRQPVQVQIGYVYDGHYELAGMVGRSFNYAAQGIIVPEAQPRDELTLTQEWPSTIGNWDARIAGLGGWTLSEHHALDGSVLMQGTADKRSLASGLPTVKTVAGIPRSLSNCGWSTDGIPAITDYLCAIKDLEYAPDGSLYIADAFHHRIRRVAPNGIISTIAGNGYEGYSGNGGPATQAMVGRPHTVKLGFDGIVYLVSADNLLRKVDKDGIIHLVGGTGGQWPDGDGGPATAANLGGISDIAVARDGTIYLVDGNGHSIRRIGTDGIITTIAGGVSGFSGDGGPASAARFNNPWGVVVTPAGELIITDTGNRRLRKIGLDGKIRTIAGTGAWCNAISESCGDGGPATAARVSAPYTIDVLPDGSLYFNDAGRVRRIGPDNIISTVVGNATSVDAPDGTPALQAGINYLVGLTVAPDGSVYYSEYNSNIVRKVEPAIPGFHAGDAIVAAEDGSVLHVLNTDGRHRRDLHPLTSDTLLAFSYDTAGWLVAIEDASGNVTTIERDAARKPTAIVGPFGHRTLLNVNADGWLETMTNPNNETVTLDYHPGGLLATLTDPRQNTYQFTYDDRGRLTRDDDPAGGFKSLARTETASGHVSSVTTALGRTTSYLLERTGDGRVQRSVTGPTALRQRRSPCHRTRSARQRLTAW